MPQKRIDVDVRRAIRLYEEGWSLTRLADELGVSPSTVHQRLREADALIRPTGRQQSDVASDEVVALYQLGMSMPQVAALVGMTTSGAWSRYRNAKRSRTSPPSQRSRHLPPEPPPAVTSRWLGRWQQILVDAVADKSPITVINALRRQLGRPPTKTEVAAARQAAHSLADRGLVQVRLIPVPSDQRSQLTIDRIRQHGQAGRPRDPARRPPAFTQTKPHLGSMQVLLLTALDRQDHVELREALLATSGREPTRNELHLAHDAARRLERRGLARISLELIPGDHQRRRRVIMSRPSGPGRG